MRELRSFALGGAPSTVQ